MSFSKHLQGNFFLHEPWNASRFNSWHDVNLPMSKLARGSLSRGRQLDDFFPAQTKVWCPETVVRGKDPSSSGATPLLRAGPVWANLWAQALNWLLLFNLGSDWARLVSLRSPVRPARRYRARLLWTNVREEGAAGVGRQGGERRQRRRAAVNWFPLEISLQWLPAEAQNASWWSLSPLPSLLSQLLL